MKQTPIVFRVDQGEHNAVFCLRQMFVSDDSTRIQKLIDNADEDQADSGYKTNVELLADWAMPWPDDIKGEDGKKLKRPGDALDSAEAVRKFFEVADADRDWISEYAVRAMYDRCRPRVTFISASQP